MKRFIIDYEQKTLQGDTMTEITITKDDILQKYLEELDTSSIVSDISYDISTNDPEWWAEQICKPLLPDIRKIIQDKSSELLKCIVEEVINDSYRTVEQQIKDILYDVVKDKAGVIINKLLKGMTDDN